MGAKAQRFSDVMTEFSYVGPSLTSNLEENVSLVHFKEVEIVDLSGSQPPFDRCSDWRPLIEGALKLVQNVLDALLWHFSVQPHNADVFLSALKKGLNNLGGSFQGDWEDAGYSGISPESNASRVPP
jgi:hypothetical protein